MNPKTSQDLFNKIRSQFSNIKIGDENGGATANPENAVFFEFEYQPDSDTFGSVSVSIADGENMKVYYNRDLVNKIDEDDRNEWYAFLKELKDFAVEHSLTFDVRDITKSNLTKQDYQNIADTSKTVNTDEMSEELARITKLAGVTEGLTGTAKRSYENLDKTRLIIRHSGKVDETVPGARSRQIQSLYIENEDGERFKYPLTHLAGARAMTRHVANGGRPHDEFGEHIIRTSEDIAKLNSFSRYVSNKDQLNDNAGDIIAQTKLKLENLREYMRNLSKQSHYENASKDFKTSEEQILDDETVAKLKEKFTMTNLDKRVEDAFPLINKVMAELENMPKDEEQVNELEPDAEPIDAPIEPPMDHGGVVTSFLTDPKKKLVLRKDDSADKMLQVTKFKNKNTMLSSILSDIASRMLSKSGEEDRVANFASRVADGLDQENSATFKPDADYIKNKKIAIQLAKRYIDDFKKMQADPKFADEIRMEPGAYNPKKDLKGKAKETEAFEGWVDSVGEATIKPYVSMYKDDKDGKMIYDVLDKDSNSAFKSKDYDAATEYLRQNYDKLREVEHQPKDKELEKKDKENAMKLDVTKADKMMNTTAFKRMQAGDERYADKTEGNEFANAVRKAKAAGMKAGDKFKVGDQEYTLKDAIEIAGLQLEEFFSEEEQAYDSQIDRIKALSFYQ
jgi:nicotinamide mononucleotide adenylyltransferase